MLSKSLLIALIIALMLAGCGTPPAPPSAAAPSAVASPLTVAPTAPTPQPSDLAADLAATVTAQLAPGDGMDVTVIVLKRGTTEQPLWAVFSTGTALDTPRVVAIYAHADSGWHELSRVTLDNPISIGLDDVAQVPFTPPDIWLAVRGSSGLVGPCCYDLLRFDGTALHNELSVAERGLESAVIRSGPGGVPEVQITVRPWTGAGGASAPEAVTVYRWNGQRMVKQ